MVTLALWDFLPRVASFTEALGEAARAERVRATPSDTAVDGTSGGDDESGDDDVGKCWRAHLYGLAMILMHNSLTQHRVFAEHVIRQCVTFCEQAVVTDVRVGWPLAVVPRLLVRSLFDAYLRVCVGGGGGAGTVPRTCD